LTYSGKPKSRSSLAVAVKAPPEPTELSGKLASSTEPKIGVTRIGIVKAPNRLQELSIPKAVAMSAGLHVFGPIIAMLVLALVVWIVAWLLHMNFWDWFKEAEKKPDMEFTLVQDTHAKKPKDPKKQGQFNQEAGGKQDQKQPLEAPEPPKQSSAESNKPEQQATPPKQAQQPQEAKPEVKAPQPKPEKKQPDKKPEKTMASKPAVMLPKKEEKPQQQTPDTPRSKAMKAVQASEASPQQVASTAASSTASRGVNNTGNPQEGKAKNPGVDVAQDADFGPFMADLERRIKRNWNPPRNSRSKRVVVKMYVSKDGRLTRLNVLKTSGDDIADDAALNAVRASAPFKPFPAEVREEVLPIEFTFDYNVFNPQASKDKDPYR